MRKLLVMACVASLCSVGLSACGDRESDVTDNTVVVPSNQVEDTSSWPKDRCGEPYEPGTRPLNSDPNLPCR